MTSSEKNKDLILKYIYGTAQGPVTVIILNIQDTMSFGLPQKNLYQG